MSTLAQGQVLPAGHACATFLESRPTVSCSIMHTKKMWPWPLPYDLDI